MTDQAVIFSDAEVGIGICAGSIAVGFQGSFIPGNRLALRLDTSSTSRKQAQEEVPQPK